MHVPQASLHTRQSQRVRDKPRRRRHRVVLGLIAGCALNYSIRLHAEERREHQAAERLAHKIESEDQIAALAMAYLEQEREAKRARDRTRAK